MKRHEMNKGILYIVATPIGNIEDITYRAIRILKEVDLIAAEDTRRTRILLEAYDIRTHLTSLHAYNEKTKGPLLVKKMVAGGRIAYCSDAGTPGFSDPGYGLVCAAIDADITVSPVPGASAAVAALSASGLPMQSFVFQAFLPSRRSHRRAVLISLAKEQRTLVFYESPHRLAESLADIGDILGDRRVVIARELTKVYEEFLRGRVSELLLRIQDVAIKGEITVIVEGAEHLRLVCSPEEIRQRLRRLAEMEGLSVRDRVQRVARETGMSRRDIYKCAIEKGDSS